jgi:hypothetical protein
LPPAFAAIADVDGEPLPIAQFNGLNHIYATQMLGAWVPAGRSGEPGLDGSARRAWRHNGDRCARIMTRCDALHM